MSRRRKRTDAMHNILLPLYAIARSIECEPERHEAGRISAWPTLYWNDVTDATPMMMRTTLAWRTQCLSDDETNEMSCVEYFNKCCQCLWSLSTGLEGDPRYPDLRQTLA